MTLEVNADGLVKDLSLAGATPEFALDLGADAATKRIQRVEIAFRTTADLAVASATARDITLAVRDSRPTVPVDVVHEKAAGNTAADFVWYPDAPLLLKGESADHEFVAKFTQTSGVTARISVFWERV